VHVAHAALRSTLTAASKTMDAGRLGEKPVIGDEVLLGDPVVFTRENIDQYQV
jgi:rhamnose transport system substrate-binding protein